MDSTDDSERLTITVEEAAKRLGISRGLAYTLARRGEIPAVRLGRRLVVPAGAIERILHERTTVTAIP